MKSNKQLSDIHTEPLVTIVTPSYNQGQYLETTIKSVLNQTYKKIEYMVFDGGSTDNSVEIIKKYEKYLTYWESCPDKGQADAINQGWRRAHGEIYAWLNSDDALVSDAVENIVNGFLSNPCAGIVYGDWSFIDENNTVLFRRTGKPTNYRKLLWGGQIKYVAQPAAFFNAECVKKVNFLNDALQLSMDYDLLLKISKLATMVYLPKEVALFRLHGETKTSTQAKRHWKETLAVQANHSKLSLVRSLLKYALFRVLNSLPDSLEMVFRRLRKSDRDYAKLKMDIKKHV